MPGVRANDDQVWTLSFRGAVHFACGGISGAKMTHMRRFKPFLRSIGIPTKPLIAKENLGIP